MVLEGQHAEQRTTAIAQVCGETAVRIRIQLQQQRVHETADHPELFGPLAAVDGACDADSVPARPGAQQQIEEGQQNDERGRPLTAIELLELLAEVIPNLQTD